MPVIPLSRLLEEIRATDVTPFGPDWATVPVARIAQDSRDVGPYTLFVALRGQNTHGIRYWPEAKRRGATALLLGHDTAPPEDAVGIVAGEPRRLTALIAARLEGEPARFLRLTGVTGTNGKTTTVAMLTQILREAGMTPAFWSTAEVGGGAVRPFRPAMTTPDAPTLQRFLRVAREHGATDAVLEVSSHAIALERIVGLPFAAAVVTNVTPDHLDFHGTFAAYRDTKQRLVEMLPGTATAVLNADDPVVCRFGDRTRAAVAWYSLTGPADAYATGIAGRPDRIAFRLHWAGEDPIVVELPVGGRHNVANALAASLVARAYGIPLATVGRALTRLVMPVRRLEPVTVGPYLVVNDVAMNRASYDNVLATVATADRPLVVVNALRGHRGPTVNRDIAAVLAHWDRRLHFAPVIVTSSADAVEDLAVDYRVRPDEREAFLQQAAQDGLACSVHETLRDAVAEGVDRLAPGGILLLLGTFGMDAGPALAVQRLRRKIRAAGPLVPAPEGR
jgi:UDP-N-acetylmuramoyl-L-alanyl-D-glutamate--2,6-diaminopimelate ligase